MSGLTTRLGLLFAGAGLLGLSACSSVPKAKAAKLSIEPDATQVQLMKTAVERAMGRSDISMDPGRLVDTSILIVRPVAIPGLTDMVPGVPTRFTLMKAGERCYLLEEGGGMRIDLPDMPCRSGPLV